MPASPTAATRGAAPPALPHKSMQIVGGTAADIKDFGHQVSWFYDGAHRCGGSIFTNEWVLTAAHCCIGASPSPQHELIAGTALITPRGRARGQTVGLAEMHVHPRFDVHIYTHDIALLRVTPVFVFDAVVHSIPIIDLSGPPFASEPVVISGWGLLKEFSSYHTPVLQKVKVFVNDIHACRSKYLEASWALPDTLMCASADRKDACQGDSGGPLIYRPPGDTLDRQVGIVSSGIGCASKDFAGLYTDLRHPDMRAFITSVTGFTF
ncbi:hypodermin-B-like [Thrips palmi]|uniref:Hypodermin-B-like n=1 Tax=Thrips palmi TaxID=161013 RepID=A0A6P9A0W8_THRPL|nr:hypodermin-B-like [Thrips palmi]